MEATDMYQSLLKMRDHYIKEVGHAPDFINLSAAQYSELAADIRECNNGVCDSRAINDCLGIEIHVIAQPVAA
jgi:hypothetical protein